MGLEAEQVVLLIGIVGLIVGIYYLHQYVSMRKWGLPAEGTIYDILERNCIGHSGYSTPGYSYTYIERHLEIGFVTKTHQLVIHQINVTKTHYKYKKGDVVNLLYEPGNTENFMIDDGASPAYMYFLCMFPGLLFLLVALWMILI